MGRARVLTPDEERFLEERRRVLEERQQAVWAFEERLLAVDKELDEAVSKKAHLWRIGVGRYSIERRITAEKIAVAYGAFCLATFALGVVFSLLNGTKELGVALVVGATFAVAAFMAQYWAIASTQEQEILDDTFDRSTRERLRALAEERNDIVKKLAQISGAQRYMATLPADTDELTESIATLETLSRPALKTLGRFGKDLTRTYGSGYEGFSGRTFLAVSPSWNKRAS